MECRARLLAGALQAAGHAGEAVPEGGQGALGGAAPPQPGSRQGPHHPLRPVHRQGWHPRCCADIGQHLAPAQPLSGVLRSCSRGGLQHGVCPGPLDLSLDMTN